MLPISKLNRGFTDSPPSYHLCYIYFLTVNKSHNIYTTIWLLFNARRKAQLNCDCKQQWTSTLWSAHVLWLQIIKNNF